MSYLIDIQLNPSGFMTGAALTVTGAVASNANTGVSGVTCFVTGATPHSFCISYLYTSGTLVSPTGLFNVNYGCTFPAPINVTWSPANTGAGGTTSSARFYISNSTTTGFTFCNQSTVPNISQIWNWNFLVMY